MSDVTDVTKPLPEAGQTLAEYAASRLRDVPDFPEPGVVFKDVTPLLADGAAFSAVGRGPPRSTGTHTVRVSPSSR